MAAFQDYLGKYPDAWSARYELSQILMSLKQLDMAETQLQAAILTAPRQAALWSRLGQVYLLQADLENAERALRNARDLDGTDAGVHYNLGRLFEKLGRDPEALSEYLAFLSLAPGDERASGVRKRVANHYENSNQPDAAIEQYRLLCGLEPSRLEYHQSLADLLYRKAAYDEANEEYQRVLSLDPNSSSAHFNVGFIAKMKGRLEEAEQSLMTADQLSPGSTKTLYTLAAVRFDRGNYAGAIPDLERVIAAEPDHPQAHYYLSRSLAKLGRLDEAKKELLIHQEILRKVRQQDSVPSTMGGD